MFSFYILFKFLHVVGAAFWIGGVATFTLLNARIAYERNAAVLGELERLTRLAGRALIGPASGLAGVAMLAVSGLGTRAWVIWGFLVIVLSGVLTATLIRRSAFRVHELAGTAEPDTARLKAAQRRLTLLNLINLLLLLSAVWAMVFKPSL